MSGLLLAVLAAVVLAAGIVVTQTVRSESPPMPSGRAMRDVMLLQASRAETSGEIRRVVELGSGWGGLTRRLALQHPRLPVLGVETSLIPLAWARVLSLAGPQNLTFERGDLSDLPFEHGDLIVAYLSRPLMQTVARRLAESGSSGLWIISSTFALPDETPLAIEPVPDVYGSPVYLYRIPSGISV